VVKQVLNKKQAFNTSSPVYRPLHQKGNQEDEKDGEKICRQGSPPTALPEVNKVTDIYFFFKIPDEDPAYEKSRKYKENEDTIGNELMNKIKFFRKHGNGVAHQNGENSYKPQKIKPEISLVRDFNLKYFFHHE
jgi:hypothetical protein